MATNTELLEKLRADVERIDAKWSVYDDVLDDMRQHGILDGTDVFDKSIQMRWARDLVDEMRNYLVATSPAETQPKSKATLECCQQGPKPTHPHSYGCCCTPTTCQRGQNGPRIKAASHATDD